MNERQQSSPLLRVRRRVLLLLLVAGLGGVLAPGCSAQKEPEPHPVLGNGTWLGGFGNLEGEDPRWVPFMLKVHASGNRVEGQLDGRFKGAVKGKLTQGGLRFSTRLSRRDLECEAEREESFLLGSCNFESERLTFRMTENHGITPDEVTPYLGLYEVAPGHRIAIAIEEAIMLAIDLKTSWSRGLFPEAGDRFFAGPKLAVPYPVDHRITFTRDAAGDVSGFVMESPGGTVEARRCCIGRTEEMTFESDGARIAGTLHLPQGEGPFPAMVWVHGSGRAVRQGAMHFPAFLAGEGYAVLAFDKRGIGKSGGSYELPDGSTYGVPYFRRRASDVLAGVRSLHKRPDIDSDWVGLVGVSQAGWVAPMAAKSEDVAFTVILSGGATALSLEDKHSRWSGENFARGGTVEDVIARLRRERVTDYDFRPDFAAQRSPGLWLYGYKDRSNPSQLAVELIEEVAAGRRQGLHGGDFPQRQPPAPRVTAGWLRRARRPRGLRGGPPPDHRALAAREGRGQALSQRGRIGLGGPLSAKLWSIRPGRVLLATGGLPDPAMNAGQLAGDRLPARSVR